MIAVTGANGQLGQLVIQHLVNKVNANEVIALVRNPEDASNLTELGVTVRAADYNQPKTIENALEGVTSLLLISSSAIGSRVAQHAAVIKAAERQGVQHFVYTSILHANTNPMLLAQEHKETEELLASSTLSTVILRNGWYTENYTQSMPLILEHKAVTGVSTNGKIHSAPRNDYAEVAASVLSEPKAHLGKVYELAGDQGFTLAEFAKEIATQSKLDILYQAMSPMEYKEMLISVGLPEGFATALTDADSQTEKGWLQEQSNTLSDLLGRPTTSMAESVKEAL